MKAPSPCPQPSRSQGYFPARPRGAGRDYRTMQMNMIPQIAQKSPSAQIKQGRGIRYEVEWCEDMPGD